MKPLSLVLIIFCLVTTFPQSGFAHDEQELKVDSAEKFVIKVTEKGFEPPTLKLTHEDSSVFVVNSSKSSLLTLSMDFKGKKTHCASSNMRLSDEGILKSSEPIAPKDFALFCIPEKGEYDLIADGVSSKPIHAGLKVE